MTHMNKFEDLNEIFACLGARVAELNKFENLNKQFTSSGIGMAQLHKFEDHSCTLLIFIMDIYIIQFCPS